MWMKFCSLAFGADLCTPICENRLKFNSPFCKVDHGPTTAVDSGRRVDLLLSLQLVDKSTAPQAHRLSRSFLSFLIAPFRVGTSCEQWAAVSILLANPIASVLSLS